MYKFTTFILTLLLTILMALPLQAQENDIKSTFDQQFNYISRVLQLAEATPADKYSWSPGENVRSVGEVYTHIVQANYMMLNALGISAPEGVDVQGLGSLNDKDEIVKELSTSVTFVLAAVQDLPDEKLSETVELFGRTLNGEAVLIFLLNHMSEHVGQSIAYARMNDITPPWNQ